jgi:hypothetical protein
MPELPEVVSNLRLKGGEPKANWIQHCNVKNGPFFKKIEFRRK